MVEQKFIKIVDKEHEKHLKNKTLDPNCLQCQKNIDNAQDMLKEARKERGEDAED